MNSFFPSVTVVPLAGPCTANRRSARQYRKPQPIYIRIDRSIDATQWQ